MTTLLADAAQHQKGMPYLSTHEFLQISRLNFFLPCALLTKERIMITRESLHMHLTVAFVKYFVSSFLFELSLLFTFVRVLS